MAEVILFTGRKGGTGKSTVCAVTAARIAAKGKRVLVAEATTRTMDVLYDVADRVVYDWKDVIEGRCTLEEALIRVEEQKREVDLQLYLLCAAPGDVMTVGKKNVEHLMDEWGNSFDYILVDLDANDEDALKAFAVCSTYAIIVTTADRAGARRNEKIAVLLENAGLDDVRLCVNQLPSDFIKQHAIPDLDWMIDTLSAQLISVIPFDPVLTSAPNIRYLVDSTSKITLFFDNLAQRIMGNYIDLSVW